MKFVSLILCFVGFLVNIDAKPDKKLLNGGQILSKNGRYIPGIIPRIFDPMYDILIKQSVPCGVGYVQMMKDLSIDTDTALVTGNAINLRFLFKVFADLTEKDLPFIRDRRLYAAYVECLKANRQEQARLSNGCIDYCAVNEFFKNAANALNDILN